MSLILNRRGAFPYRAVSARQLGAATLFVTVILLALLLVIAAVSAKIGVFELKTASNMNRSKEALHSAQGALDRAVALKLKDDTYTGESGISIGDTTASVAVTGSALTGLAEFTGYGQSVDVTGKAVVSEKYGTVSVLAAGKIPPLMSLGSFPPNGTFSIVTNPDGGGDGVPVSAWVRDLASIDNGTWQTCNWDEYLYSGASNFGSTKTELGSKGFMYCPDCECSKSEEFLCARDAGGISGDCFDIVEDNTDMKDPFEQLFAVSGVSWPDIKKIYQSEDVDSCGELIALGANAGAEFGDDEPPIYWIDEPGTCNLNGNMTIASYDHPVIVIMQGNVSLGGGLEFWGILFSFADIYADADGHTNESFNITANGGATVFGSILVNSDVNLPNGGFQLVYDESILDKLSNGGDGYDYLARLRGSWRDFE